MAPLAGIFNAVRTQMSCEAAHWGNSGSGCDEDAVSERLAQREEAMWAMKLDILSRLHVAEQVREESAFYAIDAEIEAVSPGCRRDGVSSCLLLAVRVVGDC